MDDAQIVLKLYHILLRNLHDGVSVRTSDSGTEGGPAMQADSPYYWPLLAVDQALFRQGPASATLTMDVCGDRPKLNG